MNAVLLSGSPSAVSRSSVLLEHVQQRLEARHARCDALVLRDLPAQALVHADTSNPALQSALKRVAEADLVVITTPIYKAAYSGLLKAFLDLLPQDGLHGKSVLPVATGGTVAHLLAIDYALKPVLNALGARHIAESVFVADTQVPRNAEGRYEPERSVLERLDRALLGLLEPPPRRLASQAAQQLAAAL
jgi:FMN reductase